MRPHVLVPALPALLLSALVIAGCGGDEAGERPPLLVIGGTTGLALDADTGDTLAARDIVAATVGPAIEGSRGVKFPITEGTLDAQGVGGRLSLGGGLALVAGGRTTQGSPSVEFTGLVLDLTEGTVTARANRRSNVVLLGVDLSAVQREDGDGTVELSIIATSLAPQAARVLNADLGTEVFSEGTQIGAIAIEAEVVTRVDSEIR